MDIFKEILDIHKSSTIRDVLSEQDFTKLKFISSEQRRSLLAVSFLYFNSFLNLEEFQELERKVDNAFRGTKSDYRYLLEHTTDYVERKELVEKINNDLLQEIRILNFFEVSTNQKVFLSEIDYMPDFEKIEKIKQKKFQTAVNSYKIHEAFVETEYNEKFTKCISLIEKLGLKSIDDVDKEVNFDRGENCIIFVYDYSSELVAIEHCSKTNFLTKMKFHRKVPNYMFKVLLLTPDISNDVYLDLLIKFNLHETSSIGSRQLANSCKKYIALETLKTYAQFKNFSVYSINDYIKKKNIKIYRSKSNIKFVNFKEFTDFFR